MGLTKRLLSKPVRAQSVAKFAASPFGVKHPKIANNLTLASKHQNLATAAILGTGASAYAMGHQRRDPNKRQIGRVNYHGSSSAVGGLTGKSSGGFTG